MNPRSNLTPGSGARRVRSGCGRGVWTDCQRADCRCQVGRSGGGIAQAGPAAADMIELLRLGERYRKALGVVVAHAGATGQERSQGLAHSACAPPSCARPSPTPTRSRASASIMPTTPARAVRKPPRAPIFFLKSHNTICGPGDAIKLPPNSSKVDYEAEFAVVIGKRGKPYSRKRGPQIHRRLHGSARRERARHAVR